MYSDATHALLTAINALGANQREQGGRLTLVEQRLTTVDQRLTTVEHRLDSLVLEVRDGRRSNEEHFAELKDLIIARRDG